MSHPLSFNPGSFRDPEGRVFSVNGRIFRTLSPAAAERMRSFEKDGRLRRLIDAGAIIPSALTTASQAGLDSHLCGNLVMEHEKIPLVTYPYEWSFDMLRDAALHTLDLLETCLDMGMMLKDATPFNLSAHKNRMVFMDTLSLDEYRDGRPWEGYSQFCREFLFPLMLTAYKRIEFQSWFRGELNGLKAPSLSQVFGYANLPSKGVWTHVHLQAFLERFLSRKKDLSVRDRFKTGSFPKKVIIRMVRKLRKIVAAMKYRAADSVWTGYEGHNTYAPEDERTKEGFVSAAARGLNGEVWADLGCNNGRYALVAARATKLVVGLDADPAAVNGFYRRIRAREGAACHPVVCDLLNPSPAMGWRLTERPSLFDRLRADRFLALALVHHLCIGGNVPLGEFVEMLKGVGGGGVVEWVNKKDPMVQRLLRNRQDVFPDYTWENFRNLIEGSFQLKEVTETHHGTRKLCLVLPR